jgi:spoIIIJ-associated protein
MATQEFTGKTVEEATEAAAKALGVSTDQLKVTVIEQVKGLFGKSSVRISAETVGAKPAKASKSAGAAKAARAEEPEVPAPRPEKVKKEAAKPAKPAKAEAKGGRKKTKAEDAPAENQPKAVEAEAAEEAEVVATQEDADRILATVEEVIASGGFQIKVKVASFNGRYVNVELDGQGKELGYLVGKNGEVLNALQYLLNIISSQKARNGVRLTLDANNYRQRREQALSRYAEEIAAEVAKRREEAVLDPLPAFERRIIHKALSVIAGVTTYSEGEEPNRRVVIAPAD